MITYDNGVRCLQPGDQLPNLANARDLFLDFETTSFEDSEGGFNSWKGHRTCGVCVTADEAPGSWYIPIRHRGADSAGNLDSTQVMNWVGSLIRSCDNWVNHNVKFDAHFAKADGHQFDCRLVDTLTLSKVFDSDRLYKGGYGLDALSEAFLEKDIAGFEQRLKKYLSSIKLPNRRTAKDYGLIPIDILAPYGGQDVITNRDLYRYLLRRKPDDINGVWETETLLTPVLFDIEQLGMRVDPQELMIEEYQLMSKLVRIEEQIHDLVGYAVNPGSAKDCYDLLINHFGLPILAWNDNGNPSFDKNALKSYLGHPAVLTDEKTLKAVQLIRTYRKAHTQLTFFVRPYLEHHVDGVMHPDYNQTVRSGRMSCRRPNAQQLDKKAKSLILPGEGKAFLSCDYSQIEFRLIVHYIQDVNAIRAYQEDPDTDFHTWVAEMCGIPRSPAKNVNFGIGYGAGKRKVTEMLASNMELMESLGGIIDEKISAGEYKSAERQRIFEAMCRKRAEAVYWQYHDTLPGLRPLTRAASRKILSRGYVQNAYGRRAHLSEKGSHIAFNRLIQGCAADVMKERTVALSPRYNSWMRDLGLELAGSVHDETLIVGDIETTRNPGVVRKVVECLEDTAYKFRVPIRTGAGWSDKNWAIASGDDGAFERSYFEAA